ncbi:MAG: peptide chain release factor N(5)-glutamine methyltransferase [Deltaproteobacteria bacterium]|nr:peptide chain release factor N(5)-glutamine methyltransferase [Deltaproteobacteria bacterium]
MSANDNWTPTDLVKWITEDFRNSDLPQPHRYEAELLVCKALNISRIDIYLQFDKPSTQQERSDLKALVRRRKKREPMGYILGEWEFYGINFLVGPGVLIPRSETECLIGIALELIDQRQTGDTKRILEIGTGSGAIPLALALNRVNLNILSVEISSKALSFARQNMLAYQTELSNLNSRIDLVQGCVFSLFKEIAYFDLIITNPPYIKIDEIDQLQAEVKYFEPKMALDGGVDGLDFYRAISQNLCSLLKSGGHLIFEHGFDQKLAIKKILEENKLLDFTDAYLDLNRVDRVMVYKKAGE